MYKLANPTYVFQLSKLYSASEIMSFCKRNYVRQGAYSFVFTCPNTLTLDHLKIGRTAKGDCGERMYRQAGHIYGWNGGQLKGSSGADMRAVVGLYEETFPESCGLLNISNISLHVWDATTAPNPTVADAAYPSRVCENTLLTEYESIHGRLPIGNLKDTRNEKTKGHVTAGLFSNLFDEVDNTVSIC